MSEKGAVNLLVFVSYTAGFALAVLSGADLIHIPMAAAGCAFGVWLANLLDRRGER